jgi:hypothetical protein
MSDTDGFGTTGVTITGGDGAKVGGGTVSAIDMGSEVASGTLGDVASGVVTPITSSICRVVRYERVASGADCVEASEHAANVSNTESIISTGRYVYIFFMTIPFRVYRLII